MIFTEPFRFFGKIGENPFWALDPRFRSECFGQITKTSPNIFAFVHLAKSLRYPNNFTDLTTIVE